MKRAGLVRREISGLSTDFRLRGRFTLSIFRAAAEEGKDGLLLRRGPPRRLPIQRQKARRARVNIWFAASS